MFFISNKFLVFLLIALLGANLLWIYVVGGGGPVFFGEFDSVLHGVGGLLVGLVAARYIFGAAHTEFFSSKRLHYIIVIVSFTVLVGVLWEFSEFLSDQLLSPPALLRSQPSIGDTMFDLFFDMIGGIVASVIGLRNKKKN